jgi:superfamily II RNA helicase
MVIICNEPFDLNEEFNEHFQNYSFELSDFQKYAIKSIVEGNHILITAHTGSGKTLPAEFAIEHIVAQGKKVIYTSPIKALSNQKFHEFTKKFPNISFGILTGDIKFNPEADVLIMTTEILRNTLLQKKITTEVSTLQFEMNFESELGCVIFDEVHYINDVDRGKIWEETIMFLPNHIQLVMLSATIDKANMFASWIEQVKTDNNNSKIVYLAPTNHRVVPLKHYLYTTLTQSSLKKIKDKEMLQFMNKSLHKPIEIKDNKKNFYTTNYENVKKMLNYIKKNNYIVKPSFVLNELTKYLNVNNMLPAICFVFSRKGVEKFAESINVSLFDEESTIPSTIKKECIQILRKFPNFSEYTNLPEFESITKLLEKGIAIHHSGVMPIFREMIELLFAKGYIKLLFATETFAVGINMPTKTVIFTGFDKYNGSSMRLLYPHEYTQMAGRAGRRGLDPIGHVIHLNNLFNLPYMYEYESLLNGKPQLLQSKFKITYNLVLNFHQYNNNTIDFTSKSMYNIEILNNITTYENNLKTGTDLHCEIMNNPNYSNMINNKDIYEQYYKLLEEMKTCKQKVRKTIQKTLEQLENENKQFKNELIQYNTVIKLETDIKSQKETILCLKYYFNSYYESILLFLQKMEFLQKDYIVSKKGILATYIQETHCLAFIDYIIKTNYLQDLSAIDIASLLSCFSMIRIKDDVKINNVQNIPITNSSLKKSITILTEIYDNYLIEESKSTDINMDNLTISYELISYIYDWCNSKDEDSCKLVLQNCKSTYEIFTGEFIKVILKINNITNELKNIAEYIGNVELLHKLHQIPELTLKFIATNQSLYV